jgi:hypothetical protein
MNKVAFWSFYTNFAINNSIFLDSCEWNNKLFYKYQVLKKILDEKNTFIFPLNNANLDDIETVIFYDVPDNVNYLLKKINKFKKIKKILIIEECKELRPLNWKLDIHNKFDIIFTWSNELLLNNSKYKKIYLTNLDKNNNYYKKIEHKNNSIILLNSNKKLCSKNELYSLRRSIIDFAHKNKITNFKLFGNDWDRITFSMNKWYSFLNSKRFNFIFKSNRYKNISSGVVVDKDREMSNFDFSICFENVKGIPDYFTEKITDTMIAGVIPVYYGCPNINKYFPENTYIDFQEFRNVEELFDFLIKMPVDMINEYKLNIKNFLDSQDSDIFTGDYFARSIADEILCTNSSSVKFSS